MNAAAKPLGTDGWLAVAAVAGAIVLALWRLRPRVPARTIDRRERGAGMPSRLRRWHGRRPTAEPFAVYLDALARELRVGIAVAGAFVAVTERNPAVHPVLHPSMKAVRAGRPLHEALALAHVGHPDAAFMVQALRCVESVGGPGAATLDAAAGVLRERVAVVADATAHSAQARLSARVLTIVPLAFAGWGLATSAQTRETYLASPIGGICIVAGLALNGFGWWWMRRIVGAGHDAVRPADPGPGTR